ncbi:MAG: NADP-dependent phosphogluconate dehydrogenase [Candidatus Melainabacteria bacterium]|nr:NADP-dependent phosphogluconate dehydrogenase [Candidatus Melainabacteria bacterium]
MADKAKIGLIGLGVMGENLALNIERNGFPISIYNRTVERVDEFINARGKGKQVFGYHDDKSFVESLERPRKIILLVKAGAPVDQTVEKLLPFLEKDDIIIDGGNSHFTDTIRREKDLAAKGIRFIGSGVSGGEEGALWGPSLMPGGDKKAYDEIKPIWEAIAAKSSDGPCVTYLGPNGAGHFVKMVHNGIEYGDMQLIAEVYDVMKRGLGLKANQISDIFEEWNKGILDSFLIEITAKILSVTDPETGKFLVDLIVDKAGQKGTGKWTGEIALDLGIAIPTIDAALTGRLLSALKDERVVASKKLTGPSDASVNAADSKKVLAALQDALYASKVCSYAQGMALIRAGSNEYKWNVDLSECARIWEGGCIIRAKLLETIKQAFKRQGDVNNLLVDPEFSSWIVEHQANWRYAVTTAVNAGIPVPALSASLAYFDSYRCANLPQNLTQAQRDFFGAHTYERVDKPDAGFMHTDWPSLIKEKTGKPS